MTIDNKQYLPSPSNTINGKLAEFKAWAAYRHWHKRLSKIIQNKKLTILECGCGPGFLSKLMKKWFTNVNLYVSDYEFALVERAKEELSDENTFNTFNAFQADAQKLPVQSEAIDILISFHMIEHLEIPKMFLQNAFRVLKPGGYLIYAAPNPGGIGAKIMKEKWGGIRPDHISVFSPQKWQEITLSVGFRLIEQGSTALSGIPIFQKFPLNIFNHGLLFIFGFFPWMKGEAYIGVYQKPIASTICCTNSLMSEPFSSDQLKSEDSKVLSVICCPETHQSLKLADDDLVNCLNQMITDKQLISCNNKPIEYPIDAALIQAYGTAIYPIRKGIPILL
ncbi:class I SAM-dependent methyltransferase [Nostoc sp.]|uniref:class I SAM-dependent methyltransferase n=1 Tax=Nostoc sp. TaxID=1180 RepID=UPI002FFADBE4